MKQKYVILRGPRLTADAAFRGNARNARARPSEVTVQVDELSRQDVAMLAQQSGVLALAPAMPMRLIAPRNVRPPFGEEKIKTAWGVKAVRADTSPFSGAGVVVAVLDTGIDAAHPAFAGVMLEQRDFTGEGIEDVNGHGTHCAGTIFGRPVDGMRIGVAGGITRALIGKVLGHDGGSSDSIASAMQWAAESGAHVISMSLGMDFPGMVKQMVEDGLPPDLATSRALEGYRANVHLFERLVALIRSLSPSTVIIAAAGNESRRDLDNQYEIAVSPPALSEGIISVGALGSGGSGLTIADFSNTGSILCGPGVDIASARAGGQDLVTMSGTSMAAPHVAGVAALWAESLLRRGPLTSVQLGAKLVGNSSTDAMQPGFDHAGVGAGMVTAPQV